MTFFYDNFWWQFLMTILTIFDNFDRFLTILTDFWKTFKMCRKLSEIVERSVRFFESFQIFCKFSDFLKVFVTWYLTLETLITFLTIENNNMNNYIVTFEYRLMVTAFAILAMFVKQFWNNFQYCISLSMISVSGHLASTATLKFWLKILLRGVRGCQPPYPIFVRDATDGVCVKIFCPV